NPKPRKPPPPKASPSTPGSPKRCKARCTAAAVADRGTTGAGGGAANPAPASTAGSSPRRRCAPVAFDPNGPAQPGDFQETSNGLIRTQGCSPPDPVSPDISNIPGPVTVRVAATATDRIEVRHDATSGGPDWRGG